MEQSFPTHVTPDALQHEVMQCWSGAYISHLGPGPAEQHYMPHRIRDDIEFHEAHS